MNYLLAHPAYVASRTLEHVVLVAIALAIASVIALPLGVLAARDRRIGDPLLGVLSALYTVPSLALLGLLVAWLGLGAPTAIVALVVYTQMILVRGIATGLRSVPPASIDAARGLGFTELQTLRRVAFPQALPVIVAGLRVATVTAIALATIAAWIDAGGLGTLVFEGLHQDDPQKVIAGSVAASALAVAADLALRGLERRASRA